MSKQQITCNQTKTTASHRVFAPDLNEHDTVFGGFTLSMVDNSASLSALRTTKALTASVSMDHVNFLKPFVLQDGMIMESYVTGISNRSLEVFVKVTGEHLLTGERFIGFTCFITFVILDKDKDLSNLELIPETEEQKYLCSLYEQRKSVRKQILTEDKELVNHLDLNSGN